MDRRGRWHLAPAFDVTWAYNPNGDWNSRHQMTINGRRDGFTVDDLCAMGLIGHIKAGRTRRMLQEVCDVVANWRDFAAQAGVPDEDAALIKNSFRLDLGRQSA